MAENEKKSFVFNCEWQKVLKEYPAEVRLEVYDAIIEYVVSGKLSELKPLAKMAFSFIKNEIDYNQRKYEEKVGQNRENGSKGGAPKGNKNASKQPKTTENNQNNQNNQNNPTVEKTTQTTLNDNDNIINTTTTTPHTGARACEGGKGLPVYSKLLESSLESQQWLETLCMNYHMGTERLKELLHEFVTDSECRGVDDTGKTLRDFKSHFNNWLLVRLRVENDQKRRDNGDRQGNGAAATYEQRIAEAADLVRQRLARDDA